MKIIIKESSLVHLISVFLDEMEHLDGICYVDVKKRDDGGIHLRATIKKQFLQSNSFPFRFQILQIQ